MTQPTVTLPREVVEDALHLAEIYHPGKKTSRALRAALDAPAKPVDCRGCSRWTIGLNSGVERCTLLAQDCTDFDKFQALPPISLTKVTK